MAKKEKDLKAMNKAGKILINEKLSSTKSYIVDKGALTEQLLKDDVSNWLIEKGATMILNGETPGKNMILMLEHLNIIKEK